MKKIITLIITIILSANVNSSSFEFVGEDGTGKYVKVCNYVEEDGTGDRVGEDGTGYRVGEDGTGYHVGEDGTGYNGTVKLEHCRIIPIKK